MDENRNMMQTNPPYPDGPPAMRSYGPGNASMNKYTPGNYIPPPPMDHAQGYAQPYRPRGPSVTDQQFPPGQPPPFSQTSSYGPPHGPPQGLGVPHPPPQPPYQDGSMYPPQPNPPYTDRDGYMRPPPEPRRLSASSAHSRRSNHSNGEFNDGRHRARSSASYGPQRRSHDREEDRHRHQHHRRHSDDEVYKPLKRTDTPRPSWGDTVFSMFNVIKDYLGPRE